MAATAEKPVMVVAIDESDHSYYALEWTLDHFFTPFASNPPFKLCIVHVRPPISSIIGFAGPGSFEIYPILDADLKKAAARVIEKAKEICNSRSVDGKIQVVEGDARLALCAAVDTHHASVLVVGNHGYGALKRAFLGSVSDYCSHNAHCSVMIMKRPKMKH